MEKLRKNIERHFEKLDKHWQGLPLGRQHQYMLYLFLGYLLLTAAVIGRVIYDTSKSRNDMSIEHIENLPSKKNAVPARLQDSASVILKNNIYERKQQQETGCTRNGR
ncbi:nitrogen regulatory IIA protein [Flavobacterium sp. LHD-85]|uniref:nitrogen regulatory IIA protein n=1 Tax=Flavobacterium sp. LHD-85 TaxID=3071410 RepID=UPI0027E0548D|nr:nitrogen regulatory IIA protein [Flavobacterium sp. LHD-85]MDQ6532133.1 nitrogen regulatory IIA protein [Flavobacterium sp. LHD-85]